MPCAHTRLVLLSLVGQVKAAVHWQLLTESRSSGAVPLCRRCLRAQPPLLSNARAARPVLAEDCSNGRLQPAAQLALSAAVGTKPRFLHAPRSPARGLQPMWPRQSAEAGRQQRRAQQQRRALAAARVAAAAPDEPRLLLLPLLVQPSWPCRWACLCVTMCGSLFCVVSSIGSCGA